MNKKQINKILSNITIIFLVITFIYSGFLIYKAYTTKKPQFFLGYKPVLVQTDVMAPDIRKNDIVIVKQKNIKDAKKGEIAYFEVAENARTLEKITNIREDGTIRTRKNTENKNSLMIVTEKEYLGAGLFVIQITYLMDNPVVAIVGAIVIGLGVYLISMLMASFKSKEKEVIIQNDSETKTVDNEQME